MNGQLIPTGGGDPIPLIAPCLILGRRESCDIVLRFDNVSGLHCELSFRDGYWFVRDLGSTNGIKVNGVRVMSRPLRPGDELAIAKHRFTIDYRLPAEGSSALEQILAEEDNIFGQSLLEKAGLEKPRRRYPTQDD